jgi:hypothetical protein
MTTTYEVLDAEEAKAKGGDLEALDPSEVLTPSDLSWDVPASGVFRLEDGVPVQLIGWDGGEPEDQTLGRDWSWIAPALQAAYESGRHDQLTELSPEELAGALLEVED